MHLHHEHLGVITGEAVQRHLLEADDAMDDAFAAAALAPRVRPTAWFGAEEELLSFDAIGSAEDGRHVVLICRNFELNNTNGPPCTHHAVASALALRGHCVRVVTEGHHNKVELRERLWVHHVVIPEEDVSIEAMNRLPERFTRWCAAVVSEVNRIGLRTRVDLVLGPNWDMEPSLVHHHGPRDDMVGSNTTCHG